jgi:hypothetical protein
MQVHACAGRAESNTAKAHKCTSARAACASLERAWLERADALRLGVIV